MGWRLAAQKRGSFFFYYIHQWWHQGGMWAFPTPLVGGSVPPVIRKKWPKSVIFSKFLISQNGILPPRCPNKKISGATTDTHVIFECTHSIPLSDVSLSVKSWCFNKSNNLLSTKLENSAIFYSRIKTTKSKHTFTHVLVIDTSFIEISTTKHWHSFVLFHKSFGIEFPENK